MKGRRTNKQKQNPKGFRKQLMKCTNDILVSSNVHRRSMIRGIGKLRDKTEEIMNSGSVLDNEESILEAKKKLYHKNKYVIYAFVTDKVNGFIKIGFTGDIRRRISEWKKIYGEDGFELLCPEEGWPCELFFEGVKKYFPDYTVHDIIEGHRQFRDYRIRFRRIKREEFQADVYVSKEFFERFNEEGEELTAELIGNVVRDLRDEFSAKGCCAECGTLYDFITKKEINEKGPTELTCFSDIPIQKEAADRVFTAFKNEGVKKFLLAAVMRFGKTHCTYRIISDCGFTRVIITSAKGESRTEFRKGFMHKDFIPDSVFVEIDGQKAYITGDVFHKAKENIANGNYSTDDYYWHKEINSDNLPGFSEGDGIVKWCTENNLRLVFYDTLQDMYGESGTGEIKDKHLEFSSGYYHWDLRVIDETHFAVRGEKMGKGFENNFSSDYRLDLSGTPYVILESGEFDKKGTDSWIVTYEDIEQARENWGVNHPDEPEYNNPLYGTVRRHYIIVKPTKKIVEMFGGALTPGVISKIFPDASGECEFEDALAELFERLFGSIGNGFNGLINMKDGSECNVLKHIMIKLPNDASCHYMRELFKKHNIADDRNLIVATDCVHDGKYKGKKCDTCAINSTTLNTYLWKECEEKNRGSIIFTCDRFMTASTLDLVDGVFLCGGDVSTQAVDQATGRPLTRAVLPVVDANGNACGGKYTLKTDVYIFDFCTSRMCKVVASAAKMLERSAKQRDVQNILSQKEYRDMFFKWSDMSILSDSFHEVNAINFLQIQKQALKEEGAAIINRIATSSLYVKICEKHPEFKDICRMFFSGKTNRENKKQQYYGVPPVEEIPAPKTGQKDWKPESQQGTKDKLTQKSDNEDKDQNLIEGLKNMVIRLIWTALFVKEHIVTLSSYCETVKKYHKVMSAFGFSEDILNRLSLIFKDDDVETVRSEIDRIQGIIADNKPEEKIDCINQITSLILFSVNEIKTPVGTAEVVLNYVARAVKKPVSEIKILNPFDKDGIFAEVALSFGYSAENIYSICTSEAAHQVIKLKFELLGIPTDHIFNSSYGYDSNDFIKNKECKKIVKTMHFDAIAGNPPYQNGNDRSEQIYPKFYEVSQGSADVVSLIFPSKWQEQNSSPGKGLSYLYKKETRQDKQIVLIENIDGLDTFKGHQGVRKGVNIVLWKNGYDNQLNGMQKVIKHINGETIVEYIDLMTNEKEHEITELVNLVINTAGFTSVIDEISEQTPYGMRTNVFKTDRDKFSEERTKDKDIIVYGGDGTGGKRVHMYISMNSGVIKPTKHAAPIESYKIMLGNVWGDTSSKKYYGGTYSNIILAGPKEICTQKYRTAFPADTPEKVKIAGKYLMTRFVRALLWAEKQQSRNPSSKYFKNIPIQDFHEDFWKSDNIDDIDNGLFNKYGVPEYIREFLWKKIQGRSINNIINYKDVK